VTTPANRDEQQEAHDRARPRTIVIYEAIREEGEDELARSPWGTLWSALAAGLSMTLGLVAMGAFAADLPDVPWRHLVVDLGYPLGYLIVILGRQQLFTENTLTPILPVLSAPTAGRIARVGQIWLLVLAGNIVGALAGAAFLAFAHPMPAGAAGPMADLGVALMRHDPITRFAQAVFAGWLIALMVWLLPLAETAGPFVIFLVTYVVGIAEFAHIIAGSVEVFYATFAGRLGWATYPAFFVPTLLGNIVGGVTFVTLIGFAQITSDGKKSRRPRSTGPKAAA
jgi:formate/nitrite transporter FocA (FNT family)